MSSCTHTYTPHTSLAHSLTSSPSTPRNKQQKHSMARRLVAWILSMLILCLTSHASLWRSLAKQPGTLDLQENDPAPAHNSQQRNQCSIVRVHSNNEKRILNSHLCFIQHGVTVDPRSYQLYSTVQACPRRWIHQVTYVAKDFNHILTVDMHSDT